MEGQPPMGGDDGLDLGSTPDLHGARLRFGAELRRLRVQEGHTQVSLAARMSYHASYISKMESGHHRPTRDFAKKADFVLHAGGALYRYWQICDRTEAADNGVTRDNGADVSPQVDPVPLDKPGFGDIRVLNDTAHLSYADSIHRLRMYRKIENVGNRTINRFPFRVHVDRYPENPERSRELYRRNPLTWQEIDFHCWYGNDEAIELDSDLQQTNADRLIEGWILFQARHYSETFPLNPGEQMTFVYSYTVSDEKWGRWLQRHVRFATDSLSVRLTLPSALRPRLWGKEISLRRPRLGPIGSRIQHSLEDDRTVWSWSISEPHVGDRFRFEWRFGVLAGDEG